MGVLHLSQETNCARPGKNPYAALLGDVGEHAERYARSKRSAFMTFVHAATKSCTNFSLLSSCA